MKKDTFHEFAQVLLTSCSELLKVKDSSYGSDEDRLQNFKTTSRIRGYSPEQALWEQWMKHFVTLNVTIDNLSSGSKIPSSEAISDSISDSICYMVLLKALLIDRAESKEL